MTITYATADQIEQLGFMIFDPHADLSTGLDPNPATATGLRSPSPDIDAQLAALIAEPMKTIDGRDLALGFRYTLNITNALQLRPKHWFLRYIEEFDSTGPFPAAVELGYMASPGAIVGGRNTYGYSIGLAMCSCICHSWAAIIRMWLGKNYPLAINPPPPQ